MKQSKFALFAVSSTKKGSDLEVLKFIYGDLSPDRLRQLKDACRKEVYTYNRNQKLGNLIRRVKHFVMKYFHIILSNLERNKMV